MDFWTAIATLGMIILLVMLINRIATVMLTFTGMSRDMARFQARSALSTVGFTTSESENVVNHPVRRRIVSTLMLIGNAGFVGIMATVVTTFTVTDQDNELALYAKIGLVVGLMAAIWAMAISKWLDDLLFNFVGWTLKKFTRLESYDFISLLQLSEGYSVTEIDLEAGDWPVGHTLMELRLADVGVNILGIYRKDSEFVGNPVGDTYVRTGDQLILYGAQESIAALEENRSDPDGWKKHLRVLEEIRHCREAEGGKKTEGYTLSEIAIEEGNWMVGLGVADLDVNVLGIERGKEQCFINGALEKVTIEVGDTLTVYGDREDLIKLEREEEDAPNE